MKNHKTHYRRNLPHIQPKNGVFAITIRLSGSLPKQVIDTLKDNRNHQLFEIEQSELSEDEKKKAKQKAQNLYFGKFDELLDNGSFGPTWLSKDKFAQIVADSLHFRNGTDFKLVCYCIMSNHIHLVIYKCQKQLFEIMQSFKKYTGLQCNDFFLRKSQKGRSKTSLLATREL